jgi:hypothetical protein
MLVFLLLAGGYALYKNMAAAPETTFVPAANNENTNTPNPADTGEDTQVAVAKSAAPSSAPTLPEGWPAWIPVERGSLKESSKIYYESQTTVLYSASYTTTKTQVDVWSQMSTAATKEGLSLDKDANKANGVYIAKNAAGDTFMVVTSKQDAETLVQISFLDK